MILLIATILVTIVGAIASFTAFFLARGAVNTRRLQVADEADQAQIEFEQLREAELAAAWKAGVEAARQGDYAWTTDFRTAKSRGFQITGKSPYTGYWKKLQDLKRSFGTVKRKRMAH
jgi:hypothetical protein